MTFGRKTVTIAVVCGLFLLFATVSANACHVITIEDPLVWQPTNNTSAVVNFGSGDSDIALILADDMANPLEDDTLTIATGGTMSFNQITFGRDTVSAGGQTIDIGNDLTFMFYFYDGRDYYQEYVATPEGTNMFDLSFENMSVIVDDIFQIGDISQVPVPPAILLLGSGLAGLIGFRRKVLKR